MKRPTDIHRGDYWITKYGDVLQIKKVFRNPEYSSLIERYLVGDGVKIEDEALVTFSRDFLVKKISPEEHPEYFI